jgi:hypothetical protein
MEGKSLLPARSRGDRDRGRKLIALGPEGRAKRAKYLRQISGCLV